MLFDRGVPDCIAYAAILRVDPGPSIEASHRYRYHDAVLLLEPWEEIYSTDDERTMSFADTIPFHETLVDAYERSGYTTVTVPRDTAEGRAAFLRDFVARLGPLSFPSDGRQRR